MQAMVHRIPAPQDLRWQAPLDWLFRVSPEYISLAERVALLKPATDTLIHMDYHPLNVIHDGSSVTGIVDWGGAAAGDRRADLARTCVMLETAPAPPGPLAPALGVLRRIMKRAWRAGYEEIAGPMPNHRPFQAWAAATLLGEIERVIDHPGVWGTRDDIAALRRYVTRCSGAGPPL
jgi:aminoglycoside phosphotransferase (APT) family kinase protein